MLRLMVCAGLAVLLAACGQNEVPEPDASVDIEVEETAPQPEAHKPDTQAAIADMDEGDEASSPEITASDLRQRIQTLASDEFQGRAPATPGGEKASAWIADRMKALGFAPAFNGSYYQQVPLVEATLDSDQSNLTIAGPDGAIELQLGDDVVYWTKRLDPSLSFDNSELVFAGYGAVAPEYDWNDFAGLEPEGKTAIVLVNDPGFATGDDELFTGKAMTYYGRWTYKFEEAGRQGLDGLIIVHETEPASYGWNVVKNGWTGSQLDLDRGEGGDPKAMLEGWVTRDKAEAIFAAAGMDYEELKQKASQPGFKPVPLEGVTASATLVTDVTRKQSRNVGGLIEGTQRPNEYVLYMGHWDHLGVNPDAGPDEDAIYNGAVDNATGIAGILEIGEKFAGRPEGAPQRSVMLLAVTAEESGLLGSDYFAANPPVPLAQMVAGINLDAMMPGGVARDFVVVGYGASELEDLLTRVALDVDRTISPDPNPEAGYFYRSDHISMAKRGVPMLYAEGGEDLVDGGTEAGSQIAADYRTNRYHAVTDEYDESWDLSGMVADLKALYQLGEMLADSDQWPNWYEGNEFRALRDAQREQAAGTAAEN